VRAQHSTSGSSEASPASGWAGVDDENCLAASLIRSSERIALASVEPGAVLKTALLSVAQSFCSLTGRFAAEMASAEW